MGGYLATFTSAVVFVRTTTIRFKQNGWLMMSAILFFMFSPVEFYTLVLDWKMIALDFFANPTLTDFRVLFSTACGIGRCADDRAPLVLHDRRPGDLAAAEKIAGGRITYTRMQIL